MINFYGIWVDHSHAFVIHSNKSGDMTIKKIGSDVEPHHHSGIQAGEHQTVTNQNSHEERRKNSMKAFAKELVSQVMNADELVIFGPGVAKHDVKHEVENHKPLAQKLKGVETTDKLNEHELKEYVKTFFHLPRD